LGQEQDQQQSRQYHGGYDLSGTATANYNDNCFTIPFGVSAMTDAANQSWLNAIWSRAANTNTENYYNDSIRLLSMIVMSGNWWSPDGITNTPPTITDISGQSIAVNSATGALTFTIGDAETAASALTLTKSSRTRRSVPLANVVLRRQRRQPHRHGHSRCQSNRNCNHHGNRERRHTDRERYVQNRSHRHASPAWRLQYFGVAENTGNAADLSDPDNDGLRTSGSLC
jgi:hypothetical protein